MNPEVTYGSTDLSLEKIIKKKIFKSKTENSSDANAYPKRVSKSHST